MSNKRREFFISSGIVGLSFLLSNTIKSKAQDTKSDAFEEAVNQDFIVENAKNKIIPFGIKPNDKIAITAPASSTSLLEITPTIKYYKNAGCQVVVGDTILKQKNQFRYLSAPDEVRAAEFMNFINDDSIRAIICGRGGYGVSRILRYLDFEVIMKNPKVIMGFSDITLLLLAINKMTGIITYHGPVASQGVNMFTSNNLKNTIFDNKKRTLVNSLTNIKVINSGIASGEIVGGNLTMICASLGNPYEIDTRDKLLFIEDVSEHAYQVDRMLMQLINAGKIQTAKAIIFNGFKNINSRKPFFPNKGFTILEVIEQLIKPFGLPLIHNFEFGHEDNMYILPIGINAKIDTEKKVFELLENPVV